MNTEKISLNREKVEESIKKLDGMIMEAVNAKNWELFKKLMEISKPISEARLADSKTQLAKTKRRIAKSSIELWKLPEEKSTYTNDVRSEILNIVDTRTGKITEYQKTGEHIHRGMTPQALRDEDPEYCYVSTDEYFGCNGYKRLKLVEDSLKEIEEE